MNKFIKKKFYQEVLGSISSNQNYQLQKNELDFNFIVKLG